MKEKNIKASSRIAGLISGYLLGKLSSNEVRELEEWINASEVNADLFKSVLNEKDLEQQGLLLNATDVESDLLAAKSKIKFITIVEKRNYRQLWLRVSGIAAAAALILIGVYFFNLSVYPGRFSRTQYTNDVKPGSNKAVLTFSNGKTIYLNGAKSGVNINASGLKYNDGSALASGEVEEYMLGQLTATTPRGGTYQFILPDGTIVWLNSASSLQFPSTFDKLKERKVILTGEAYFEVTKNIEMPFKVVSNNQVVEVLGTHFNIHSYSEEAAVKTTLLEGIVRVKPTDAQQDRSQVLRPGQQSVVTGRDILVRQVDLDEAIAWKKGEFMFIDQPLEDIMISIARWYDVSIEYEDAQIKNETFGGTISRFDKVSKVLNMLQLTGNVHFKIEGRRITVMR